MSEKCRHCGHDDHRLAYNGWCREAKCWCAEGLFATLEVKEEPLDTQILCVQSNV